MVLSHIILAVGWILFGFLHSALAASKFKEWARSWMGTQFRFYRVYYTVFAFISFVAVVCWLLLLPSHRLFSINIYVSGAGILVSLGGLAIMVVCARKYFMQATGVILFFTRETQCELMRTGIHRYVRHPMYGGTFLFIWGLFLAVPSISFFIVNGIITAYTLIGLHFEEEKLQKEFGQEYINYKKSVPMLVPRPAKMLMMKMKSLKLKA